jgi:hypothetical protein
MRRRRSGGLSEAGSRRVLAGSLVKRTAAAGMILALAMAADAPRGDKPAAAPERIALTEAAASPIGGTAEADLSAKSPVKEALRLKAESPSARAVKEILACRARFANVKDYTCTFYKRERIDGELSSMNVMTMKMRNAPYSIYFRFHQPNKGREAIFVEGRNDGRILAHDVGFTKLLAGTMKLDPHGARAMENCRHPITKAGIGHLIETIADRWQAELSDEESVVLFDPKIRVGSAPCLLVEAIHPEKKPGFYYHKVRLFIDAELGIPIRYEAYDWPAKPGGAPELLEEYAYDGVKLNVGLGDGDFDAANQLYSFGRF